MRKLKKILMLIGFVTVCAGLGAGGGWFVQNDMMSVQYTQWFKDIAYWVNIPSGGLAGLILFLLMNRR